MICSSIDECPLQFVVIILGTLSRWEATTRVATNTVCGFVRGQFTILLHIHCVDQGRIHLVNLPLVWYVPEILSNP